jgi:hypothetical protein
MTTTRTQLWRERQRAGIVLAEIETTEAERDMLVRAGLIPNDWLAENKPGTSAGVKALLAFCLEHEDVLQAMRAAVTRHAMRSANRIDSRS